MKFKVAGKEVFRSKTVHKNLNPVWDERVSLLVETLRDPLYVKVRTHPHSKREVLLLTLRPISCGSRAASPTWR